MPDPTRGFEMPFSPTPPSQTNGVNGQVQRQRARRVDTDAARVAEQVAHARRRARLVQVVEQLPPTAPIPAPPIRSVPPTFTAEVGGCVECGHTESVHTRGRDTPIPCTAPGCGCLGFVDGRATPLSVLAWGSLAVALILAAAVFAFLGQYGVAFLVIAGAAIAGGLAWIHDAPTTRGGR